jgi:phosphocarrier protein HPr
MVQAALSAAKRVTIVNKRGLHARAAAKFAKLAATFQCDITVERNDLHSAGRNILDLLMLAASQGKDIEIICHGPDADNALQALCDLVERGFDETDDES